MSHWPPDWYKTTKDLPADWQTFYKEHRKRIIQFTNMKGVTASKKALADVLRILKARSAPAL